MSLHLPELLLQPIEQLQTIARQQGVALLPHQTRDEFAAAIATKALADGDDVTTEGLFAVLPDGFGFLRMPAQGCQPSAVDAYVSPSQMRALNLKIGHRVRGPVRAPRGTERFFALTKVEQVQGVATDPDAPSTDAVVAAFGAHTPIVPSRPWDLSSDDPEAQLLAARAPLLRGQRQLLLAPSDWPRARLLARVAARVHAADRNAPIMLCLLDQRPEDIAAARADCEGTHATVLAAEFATDPALQAQVAELAWHAAMRDAEHGHDAVLLLDSLTAWTRAVARSRAPSGAWARPGLDAKALQPAKQMFASARQCRHAGARGTSLTIVASANYDPDAALDRDIAAEFLPAANSTITVDGSRVAAGEALPFDRARTLTRPEDDVRPPRARATALAATETP